MFSRFIKEKIKRGLKSKKSISNDCTPNFKQVVLPPPEFYYVDICNICNLKCYFCPTGQRKKGLSQCKLSLADYAIILAKISPYAKQIHLYNWGEPFLNDDILSIITLTADKNIFTAIHSNLAMRDISDSEAAAIVDSGLSFLNISLDGASQETYGKYRRGGSFRRVINNIRQIQRAKERSNADMIVRWRFLLNAFNEHEQSKAVEMARDLNVILQFDLMGVQDNAWATDMHNSTDVSKFPIILYDKPIPESINLSPISPVKLSSKLKCFCAQPFNWMTINCNGDVAPCCSVYGDQYSVGNMLQNTLEEVWNGGRMLSCREFLSEYGPRQHTQSICETLPCGVNRKSLDEANYLNFANFEIVIGDGVWIEEKQGWLWISDKARLTVFPRDTGLLGFDFIFPDHDSHKTLLPFDVRITKGGKIVFDQKITSPGTINVKIPLIKDVTEVLFVECNKFIIPDESLGNGDKRRLSLIVDNFNLL